MLASKVVEPAARSSQERGIVEGDARWYQDAVVYQVHLRAFRDADGDGIGDLRGLIERLDYLQDLGITALWLLPFYPSPLRDDGYDIADYKAVHPDYGTLEDVRALIEQAHLRGLRVITELVCNHTSDQHAWFQRARRAPPGSPERDFYVWRPDNAAYRDARIIFKDFEASNWAWDPLAKAYYWHRFYAHQPDLNFDHPPVRAALLDVVDFWFGMGVDGLRLDAIPYLYEREGTSCENLPETHAFLRELRAHVDARWKDRMLLAEANQWPEDAAAYFGQGDECHMAFHFPLMPRLFMGLHLEDRFPIVDILAQTPQLPDGCQWALFLRNHDELTLEMVTEEERGMMWRAYAREARARINLGIRRRLAPLLGNDRRRVELMLGLLLSLPGTPVLYYGDEIGMGDNIWLGDRNGVRTPMQWSPGLNAGFSEANRQRLFLPVVIDPEYHYESVNVSTQQQNPHSLLWWTKRIVALRRKQRAFGRGSFELVHADNFRVLAYVRRFEEERILVVANLSRFVQHAELDLSAHRGLVPTELMGRVKLPAVGDRPYPLVLAPHAFYWLSLEPPRGADPAELVTGAPTIKGSWPGVAVANGRPSALDEPLAQWLSRQRWFQGHGRGLRGARLLSRWSLAEPSGPALTLVEASYLEGDPESYAVPLAPVDPAGAERVEDPQAEVARLASGGLIVDGLRDPGAVRALLHVLRGAAPPPAGLRVETTPALAAVLGEEELPRVRAVLERRNTVVDVGGRAVLKVYRRVEPGPHPERELLSALVRRDFAGTPRLLAALEHAPREGPPTTLAVLMEHVSHEADAWHHALDAAGQFLERRITRDGGPGAAPPRPPRLVDLVEVEPPSELAEEAGAYLAFAGLVGQRVAELHLTLAAELDDPALAPEPMTPFYQRSLYQSLRNQVGQTLRRVRASLADAPEGLVGPLEAVLRHEARLQARLRPLLERKVEAPRVRIHGDLELIQVLRTGVDVVLVDLEGDPTQPLDDRRLKRTVLRDLASLIRSFRAAARIALRERALREQDALALEPWARSWADWASAALLRAYAQRAPALLPAAREDQQLLLDVHVLGLDLRDLEHQLAARTGMAGAAAEGVLQDL